MNPIFKSVPAYVEEQRGSLIRSAVLKAKSVGLFNLQTDVKSVAALNLLNTNVEFGDGNTCGFTDAGTSTISQRKIETGQIKINMKFCDKDMLKYFTQYQVKIAAGIKTLPFEEDFVNGVLEDVQTKLEKAIYQGDKLSEDANLNKFDGLIKILNDGETTVKATITGTDAYADVMTVYNAIPSAALNGASILVGFDMFRAFINKMVEKNLFNYSATPVDNEIVIPGTNVKLIAVAGLDGTKKIIAGQLDKNVFYGCDMVNDSEVFDLWYSRDEREFRLAIEFNAGVQCAVLEDMVLGSVGA